jgi:hypothetical protein
VFTESSTRDSSSNIDTATSLAGGVKGLAAAVKAIRRTPCPLTRRVATDAVGDNPDTRGRV